ncbi:hypothetical protein GQ600_17105 [Phytophthora cactorum]|nr:hypothetical protein GQ600_17105 [Phytophthora cactorum]
MLEAAKKNPGTEEIATRLQRRQKFAEELQIALFSQWLREGAQPKQIWSMLRLEKATRKGNPNGEIWRGYRAFYYLHNKTIGQSALNDDDSMVETGKVRDIRRLTTHTKCSVYLSIV